MDLNTIYIIIIFSLVILCVFLCYKLYKFSILILDIEDAIEQSLDRLDDKYNKISEVLKIPIFFDSVEVRQVVNEIRDCRRAVLEVAHKLTNNIGTKSDFKKEDGQDSEE